MAIFIPHRCPKCFETVTLIQPQHKGGAFKEPAKGHCLNCMDEQEYYLTVPVNRRDLIHVIGAVKSKADTLIYAGVSFGRPRFFLTNSD
jgi:hypothetical protein